MKKVAGVFILVWLFAGSAAAKNVEPQQDFSSGSGIAGLPVDSKTLDNLNVLCKVWGFVKYHHPVFADSVVDVDQELFKLLPRMVGAGRNVRNRVLSEWIGGLGKFSGDRQKYERMLDTLDDRSVVDLDWIADTRVLGRDLSGKLESLRYADRRENRYVHSVFDTRRGPRLLLDHEPGYWEIADPDCGYRLLALFRYWNLIEYFYPYKPLLDKSWGDVLTAYIPRVVASSQTAGYRLAMCGLTTELHDAHAYTNMMYKIFGGNNAPVDAAVVEGKFVVVSSDKFEESSGRTFAPGDEILQINGKTIDSIASEIAGCASYANPSGLNKQLPGWATACFGDTAKVVYARGGKVLDTIVRTISPAENYKAVMSSRARRSAYRLLGDSIGYIYAGNYRRKEVDSMIRAVWNTKGLVIDLRTYPAEPLIFFVNDRLFGSALPFICFDFPLTALPGCFYRRVQTAGRENPEHYRGKVVVLVNEGTQSQGETTTMLLQALPGTVVIGSQTAGSNGDIKGIDLPGGFTTAFSSIGVCYPDGTQIQRTGVRIDEQVNPTVRGIIEGRDELLERAVEIIEAADR